MTRCKAYFKFFPNTIAFAEEKVLLAAGSLESIAKSWFNLYLKDYIDYNNNADREDKIQEMFIAWENFKDALKAAFRIVNKEREVVARLRDFK